MDLFQFYMSFPINDHTGEPLAEDTVVASHYDKVRVGGHIASRQHYFWLAFACCLLLVMVSSLGKRLMPGTHWMVLRAAASAGLENSNQHAAA